MSAPKWAPLSGIISVHDRQISRHGGTPGLRDLGLLEAGCARSINRHTEGEEDLFILAAAYAFGIAKAHAFVDGNKRTAFVTTTAILGMNGWRFKAEQADIVRTMVSLASDDLDEAAFADWLRTGAKPRD